MKAYITKYALTDGIGEESGDVSAEYPKIFRSDRQCWNSTYIKPHWHATREEAVARANEMRDKAIRSAKRKIEKLRKMRFE